MGLTRACSKSIYWAVKSDVYIDIIGERAKRARHSQVCSIENRGYSTCNLANFVLRTRKEGGA